MSVANFPTFPYDFGSWTGPTRTMSDYARAGAITTNTPYGEVARAIWVGGTGAVAVVLPNGSSVIFAAVPAGVLLPVYSTQVLTTGTTATNLIWLS